jgi:hypothetical protein
MVVRWNMVTFILWTAQAVSDRPTVALGSHVRLFCQVGPVMLFVAALYCRFARHDALRFYVFFGAAAIVACFYLFRYGND